MLESHLQEKDIDIDKLNKTLNRTKRLKDEEISNIKNSLVNEKQQYQDEKELINNLKKDEAEINKLKKLLKSKVVKNKKLKDLVAEAKSNHEQLEKGMKEELEESKVLKENLSEALEEAKKDLESQLHDVRAQRDKAIEEKDLEHRNVLKKVSDLHINMINENLNEESKDLHQNLKIQQNRLKRARGRKTKCILFRK